MSEKINANQDNDRQITLVDDQGNEELFEILFTFTSEDYGKSYVLLYPAAVSDDDDVEVQAFSYDADEDGDVISSDLHEITDDDEWNMVQGVLNTFFRRSLKWRIIFKKDWRRGQSFLLNKDEQ